MDFIMFFLKNEISKAIMDDIRFSGLNTANYELRICTSK